MRAWAPAVGLFGVQVAALCLFAATTPLGTGFPLDDAWIHQLVARSFVETGSFGVDPERFASGASSLLWPLLLAINPVSVAVPPVAFSEMLNVALYVVTGQLLRVLLERDGAGRLNAFLAASLAALSGNFLWFAFSGMEATLVAALVVGAVAAWVRPEPQLRSALVAGGLLAAAALTRPEAVGFAAIVAVTVRWVRRPLSHAAACAAPATLAFASYLVATAGGPSTMAGRRWMFLAYGQGLGPLEFAAEFLMRWAERLAIYSLGLAAPALFWVATGLAVVGAGRAVLRQQRGITLLLAITLAHLFVYAVWMPTEGHGGRYQPLVPFLFLPLVFFGASACLTAALAPLSRSTRLPSATLAALLSAALIAIPAATRVRQWGADHALAVQHVEETEVRMGLGVRELPASARIASFDLGGIGYFSRRALLDLGALVDPSVLPWIRQGRTDELLLERGVEYVIVPMGYSDEFPDPWNFAHRLNLGASRRLRFEKVAEVASAPRVWVPGLEATLHSSPRQVLYKVVR